MAIGSILLGPLDPSGNLVTRRAWWTSPSILARRPTPHPNRTFPRGLNRPNSAAPSCCDGRHLQLAALSRRLHGAQARDINLSRSMAACRGACVASARCGCTSMRRSLDATRRSASRDRSTAGRCSSSVWVRPDIPCPCAPTAPRRAGTSFRTVLHSPDACSRADGEVPLRTGTRGGLPSPCRVDPRTEGSRFAAPRRHCTQAWPRENRRGGHLRHTIDRIDTHATSTHCKSARTPGMK